MRIKLAQYAQYFFYLIKRKCDRNYDGNTFNKYIPVYTTKN